MVAGWEDAVIGSAGDESWSNDGQVQRGRTIDNNQDSRQRTTGFACAV